MSATVNDEAARGIGTFNHTVHGDSSRLHVECRGAAEFQGAVGGRGRTGIAIGAAVKNPVLRIFHAGTDAAGHASVLQRRELQRAVVHHRSTFVVVVGCQRQSALASLVHRRFTTNGIAVDGQMDSLLEDHCLGLDEFCERQRGISGRSQQHVLAVGLGFYEIARRPRIVGHVGVDIQHADFHRTG